MRVCVLQSKRPKSNKRRLLNSCREKVKAARYHKQATGQRTSGATVCFVAKVRSNVVLINFRAPSIIHNDVYLMKWP